MPKRTPYARRSITLIGFSLLTLLAGCGRPFTAQTPAVWAAATAQADHAGTAANQTTPPGTEQPITPLPAADPRVRTACQPLAATESAALNGGVPINVQVDPNPTGATISPLIYGVAVETWTDPAGPAEHFRDMGVTAVRWGGNQSTRYNWELNTTNSGSDWYFANTGLGAADAPAGKTGDDFVAMARAVGAQPLLSIPAMGYVARDGNDATRSTNVPDDGNAPAWPGAEAIPGYDPAENQRATSIKSYATKNAPLASSPDLTDDAVYQNEWVQHVTQTWGPANAGGVGYYAIDNEPDLWSNTHRDVHPVRMGYDAMLANFQQYADAIKAVDPSAHIVAPDISGITGFFFSALDRGDDNFATHADRQAHGDQPFLAWWLSQIRQHDEQTGTRSLDVLTVHNYPQSGVYPGGNDPEQNALRLRSTQQLWNPNYTDESWISDTEAPQLQLIPRLHALVDQAYPGTKIGITEWNYGNDDQINGGLTIADVLGIFGRERLDMANYWTYPKPGTPGASAFKLYNNYDNCGRHFGDQLLTTQSSDEQTLSAYGSRDSFTGNLLVTTINKRPDTAVQANFNFNGIGGHVVEVYQFNADHTAIQRLPDASMQNGNLSYTVPPYAATLFVVKP